MNHVDHVAFNSINVGSVEVVVVLKTTTTDVHNGSELIVLVNLIFNKLQSSIVTDAKYLN